MKFNEDGSILVWSGDDDSFTFYYEDLRDISDYEFFFTVKPTTSATTDDSDALLSINPSDVTYTTSNTKAIIPVAKSSVRIPAGTYKYDFQKVVPDGSSDSVTTTIGNLYKVANDVTKRVA